MDINFKQFEEMLVNNKLASSLPVTVCSHSKPVFMVVKDEPKGFKGLCVTTSPMRRARTARKVAGIGIHRLEKRRNNSEPEILGYIKKPQPRDEGG